MADEFDRAAEISALFTDPSSGVAAARHQMQKAGSAECVDCGDVIPQARREAYPSATRCVFCQTEMAQMAGQTGRTARSGPRQKGVPWAF